MLDGWPRDSAEMTGEELRDRLRHYLFFAASGPNRHAGRIAQLLAEAAKPGKAEMVDEAMQWVRATNRRNKNGCTSFVPALLPHQDKSFAASEAAISAIRQVRVSRELPASLRVLI
jgi:thioesterase domain-containing protein